MMDLALLPERLHLPLVALGMLAGLALAAVSRDLMQQLSGAAFAMLAAATHLVVVSAHTGPGAGAAVVVIAVAGVAMGCVAAVRVREAFGSATVKAVRAGLEDDAAQAEREA